MIDTLVGDRYRVTTLIARGGMADVYAAHDGALDRTVAIKLLRPRDNQEPDEFLGELLAQGRVTHEAVVRLYDAGSHDGMTYLVMEHIAGQSLRERIADGQLPVAQCAEIGRCLAEALDCAHRIGIIHQDIKPANVLLDHDGNVRLADFGIARLAEMSRSTGGGSTLGTAAYLAPEQVAGEEVGPAADVYALGLVLLEALSGRREYPGPTLEAVLARLSRDPAVPEHLPNPWPSLLRAMTARDPAQRPSAAEVAAQLPAAAAAGPELLAPAAGMASDPPPDTGRRWPAVAAIAAALLLVAALLAVAAGDVADPAPRDVPDVVDETAPEEDPPAAPAAEHPEPADEGQPPHPLSRGQAKGADRGKDRGR